MKGKTLFQMTVLAAGFFFGAAGVWGQGGGSSSAGGASATAPAQKIAVINIRQAIIATAEGKQASAELQSKYAPRSNELDNLGKQINDLQSRLAAGERTLSEDEQNRIRREGQRLTQQLDRKRTEYQEDLNNEQSEIVDRIGRKVLDVLDRYARENGYDAVLDTSAQNTPVIYASNKIDITQDIVRLYDQAYPVRAGTAAPAQPRPAQPKPATQPPAQQKPPQQKPQ